MLSALSVYVCVYDEDIYNKINVNSHYFSFSFYSPLGIFLTSLVLPAT